MITRILFRKKPIYKDLSQSIFILFGSIIAGFTITDLPKEFLDFFTTPLGQFIAFYAILNIMYMEDEEITRTDILIESLVYVGILQMSKIVLNKVYSSA